MLLSKLSNIAAANLQLQQNRAVANDKIPNISLTTWQTIPLSVRRWLKRKVLKPSDVAVWNGMRSDADLNRFWSEAPNPYAISPTTIKYLWHLLQLKEPRQIVEFGGGTSTRLCALYAAKMKMRGVEVKIVSIDHEQEWADDTASQIAADGFSEFVDVIWAPLSEQNHFGREMTTYTIPPGRIVEATDGTGFDLCMVDGPPRRIGRSGALAIASPYLADGCRILLDDGYRNEEQQAIREWLKLYPKNLHGTRLFLAGSHGTIQTNWHC